MSNEPEGLMMDKRALEELKLICDATRLAGRESFVFQGHEILVSYAGYLIEYLETRIK